jgi:hypothetical protein
MTRERPAIGRRRVEEILEESALALAADEGSFEPG